HLPTGVEALYQEARSCMTTESYTAVVMLCRALLLHIAVEKGLSHKHGLSFADCIHLIASGLCGAGDRAWVDSLRILGNDANHDLKVFSKDEANRALKYMEHLLEELYEFPEEMDRTQTEKEPVTKTSRAV